MFVFALCCIHLATFIEIDGKVVGWPDENYVVLKQIETLNHQDDDDKNVLEGDNAQPDQTLKLDDKDGAGASLDEVQQRLTRRAKQTPPAPRRSKSWVPESWRKAFASVKFPKLKMPRLGFGRSNSNKARGSPKLQSSNSQRFQPLKFTPGVPPPPAQAPPPPSTDPSNPNFVPPSSRMEFVNGVWQVRPCPGGVCSWDP